MRLLLALRDERERLDRFPGMAGAQECLAEQAEAGTTKNAENISANIRCLLYKAFGREFPGFFSIFRLNFPKFLI